MFIHDKITFKLISRCGGIRNVCFLSRMLVKMNSAKTMQPVKQVLRTDRGYRCICTSGFEGKYCEIGKLKLIRCSFTRNFLTVRTNQARI